MLRSVSVTRRCARQTCHLRGRGSISGRPWAPGDTGWSGGGGGGGGGRRRKRRGPVRRRGHFAQSAAAALRTRVRCAHSRSLSMKCPLLEEGYDPQLAGSEEQRSADQTRGKLSQLLFQCAEGGKNPQNSPQVHSCSWSWSLHHPV